MGGPSRYIDDRPLSPPVGEGPGDPHQLGAVANELAAARVQLAEARERRRRLQNRLRDYERRAMQQRRAAAAQKAQVIRMRASGFSYITVACFII